jgi:hypothetical protein
MLDTLRALGGSARSTEVYRQFELEGVARNDDLAQRQPSGETRFVKEVRFARKELVDAGLVVNGVDGVWSLSLEGWRTRLTPESARELIKRRRHSPETEAFGEDGTPTLRQPGPTRGPPPGSWTTTVTRSGEGEGWTYVLRFGESDVWKIGYAEDVEVRLGEVNTHVPFELLLVQWVHYARHWWPCLSLAYQMEQRILSEPSWAATDHERVRCTEEEILLAWRRGAISGNCEFVKVAD